MKMKAYKKTLYYVTQFIRLIVYFLNSKSLKYIDLNNYCKAPRYLAWLPRSHGVIYYSPVHAQQVK